MTQPYDETLTAQIARTLAASSAETAKVLADITQGTTKQVTAAISEIRMSLALLNQSIDTLSKEVRHINGDHESRIRKLEESDRKWAAVAIGASVIVTAAVKLLWP